MPIARSRLDEIMAATAHRPWPLPTTPWLMTQAWDKLAFMHWPVSPEVMRAHVPEPLELDLRDGSAWIGLVPFWIPDESLRGRIKLPLAGSFVEMNVRTYVSWKGMPGVYFLSLDASNHVAVLAARFLYMLNYFYAKMDWEQDDDGWIRYRTTRRHSGAPIAEFKARYRPLGGLLSYDPNAIERWLSERYALYTVDDGHVFRGNIHHPIWDLYPAEVDISLNTMASCWGIDLPDAPPLLHYSEHQDTVIWPLLPA
jgi:uncharacterized protein YqjF (DUF2071 family)